MPGVKIGDNVVIGVGSIVTKNIPSNCVAAGVPAKIIRSIEEYHKKYSELFTPTKNMTKKEKRKYLSQQILEKIDFEKTKIDFEILDTKKAEEKNESI
jgi:carbonic anhydrase/acetyltransferase-like protein (isoleucine patch superfamily)